MSRATIEILLATAATSIEVAFTLPGGTGAVPDGGAQFAVLQKQSAANGDFGWTNAPQVHALQFDLVTPPATLAEGQSRWNPTVRTVETALGEGVTLQHGFETFRRAANFTGDPIPDGKLVAFDGVDAANAVPKMRLMLADGSIPPLYIMGVTTEAIDDSGAIGRLVVFGEAHDLDTTGAPYGETWAAGDVLYASPTAPGGLTKDEPPPPLISSLVGSVQKVGVTDGVLFIRPQLAPALRYGNFSSSVIQTQTAINTPKAAVLNTTNFAQGVSLGSPASRVVCAASGLYAFQFQLLVEKASASQGTLYVWARKNGVDVPNSAAHMTISGSDASITPSWSFVLSMAANDYFELVWAVDTVNITLHAHAALGFGPAAPSVILTVTKINQ